MADTIPIAAGDHAAYMEYALSLARKAPPKATNFCVGAVLIDELTNKLLSTGFTMELPGNTHAEQCCLMKYHETAKGEEIPQANLVLYTTMEPCNKRASGNIPCTDTILSTQKSIGGGIKIVYVGVKEPEKFVGENTGRTKLENAGIAYIHVPGFEEKILAVATAGHEKQ